MPPLACERCGQRVFFRNDVCLACQTPLAFDPTRWRMVGLEAEPGTGGWRALDDGRPVRPCAHRARDRKSTRLNSSHSQQSRMPSSA